MRASYKVRLTLDLEQKPFSAERVSRSDCGFSPEASHASGALAQQHRAAVRLRAGGDVGERDCGPLPAGGERGDDSEPEPGHEIGGAGQARPMGAEKRLGRRPDAPPELVEPFGRDLRSAKGVMVIKAEEK